MSDVIVEMASSPLLTGDVTLPSSTCAFEAMVSEGLMASPDAVKSIGLRLQSLLESAYPVIWDGVLSHLPETHWALSYAQKNNASQQHSLSLNLLVNSEIQRVNAAYRAKDAATDVLTFPALESDDSEETLLFSQLPELELGEIMVSIDYALDQAGEDKAISFLLERIIHGSLHLLGVHHDTISEYNKVIGIQADILNRLETVLSNAAAS